MLETKEKQTEDSRDTSDILEYKSRVEPLLVISLC